MDEKKHGNEEAFGALVGEMAFWLLRKSVGSMDFSDKGLTEAQFTTAMLIRFFDNPTMTELSQVLSISMPTLTGIIDKLVKNEIVERNRDENDRRVVRVSVTDSGDEIIRKIHEKKNAHMKLLIRMLEEEDQKELVRITNIIVQRLREEARQTSIKDYFNGIMCAHNKMCLEKK